MAANQEQEQEQRRRLLDVASRFPLPSGTCCFLLLPQQRN